MNYRRRSRRCVMLGFSLACMLASPAKLEASSLVDRLVGGAEQRIWAFYDDGGGSLGPLETLSCMATDLIFYKDQSLGFPSADEQWACNPFGERVSWSLSADRSDGLIRLLIPIEQQLCEFDVSVKDGNPPELRLSTSCGLVNSQVLQFRYFLVGQ